MSGHSKWHSIKHKKGALDAKRGKLFTKLIRELTIAARGGGDPDANPRLRKAISDAKAANMPNDTIQRAIDRGTGKIAGESLEEVVYEGYGPGGVAIMVEAVTSNKNRTVSELRHLFSRHNGNLGESGCVAWMFETKGYITFDKGSVSEDQIYALAIEAGADDVTEEEGAFEIITAPENFEAVLSAVKQAGLEPTSASITKLPQNYVKISGKDAQMMLKLYEALDEHDDVQHVFANFDIPQHELEAAATT
ncbi:MAG: YebC/PmpR family DNA-binding transcriptional regulator [Acidobacteriota bacterium]|nr:YebC/PmpR family DNA-binding transcriptional regulator [Blastocatellia bacterium]MDW8240430.1 YebC/PmpR family DNA-binding transcriptional regulator [Acidobacteriota bacterium]